MQPKRCVNIKNINLLLRSNYIYGKIINSGFKQILKYFIHAATLFVCIIGNVIYITDNYLRRMCSNQDNSLSRALNYIYRYNVMYYGIRT